MSYGLHALAAGHRLGAEADNDLAAARDHIDRAEAWEMGYSDLLCIVSALASCDPVATSRYIDDGAWCQLCDAEPPGGASTLAPENHRADCPWVQAQQFWGL